MSNESPRKQIRVDYIPDEDYLLLRSVDPNSWDFEKNRPRTGVLISQEISTDWAALRTIDDFMQRHDRRRRGHGLIRFRARVPRSVNVVVEHDPNPPYEPDNNAHTLLKGKKSAFGNCVKNRELVEIVEPARKDT